MRRGFTDKLRHLHFILSSFISGERVNLKNTSPEVLISIFRSSCPGVLDTHMVNGKICTMGKLLGKRNSGWDELKREIISRKKFQELSQ